MRLSVGSQSPKIPVPAPTRPEDFPARPASQNRSHGPASQPIEAPLATGMTDMTRTVLLDAPSAQPASPDSDFVAGGFTWRSIPEFRDALAAARIDWLALRDSDQAVRVKRNGHRDVWRLTLQGEPVFVKRYRSDSWGTRLKAAIRGPTAALEWDVGRYAARHGIAAVRPLACAWSGTRMWSGPSLLITRAVAGSVPLCDYWLTVRRDFHRASSITRGVARLVARAHQCGFQHQDMHAGNILVQTEQVAEPTGLFVDLHNVRIEHSVSTQRVIANLAQLNQWFRRHATRAQRLRFLKEYLSARDEFAQASEFARNWTIDPRELLTILSTTARRHAESLWAKRDRRSMRTGRYFARISPAAGWRGNVLLISKHPRPTSRASQIIFETRQWRRWLADPTQWTDPTCNDVLKDSHSAVVCRAALDTPPTALPVICKRPLPRSLWKRLLYAVGPSRNLRAWRRANMLLNRDLPAALPLAVVERRALGLLRTDSILITELIEDAVDLEAFLVRSIGPQVAAVQRRAKDALIASVVRLVFDMADRGFIHRDMKAPNLLVRWAPPFDGAPDLTLIDMDGIRHRRGAQLAAAVRAIVRLNVSLSAVRVVTRTDRLRFLRSFLLATGQPLRQWKELWAAMRDSTERKRHVKELRTAWKLAHYGRA